MCTMCLLSPSPAKGALHDPDVRIGMDAQYPPDAFLRALSENAGDAASSIATRYSMEVGDTFAGNLTGGSDWDWISIDLVAGQSVEITMDGTMPGGVSDTYLILHGPNGNGGLGDLVENDDFGSLDFSRVVHTAQVTGTYYIVADSYDGRTDGSYLITVQDTAPPDPVDAIAQSDRLSDTSISVYFAPNGVFGGQSIGNFESDGFNAYEIAQFRKAFDLIEAVTNLSFTVTTSIGAADFVYVLDADNEVDFLGAHEFPNDFGAQHAVFSGNLWDRTPGGDLEVGGYGFVTMVHEALHGVGLSHPHDDAGGTLIMNGVIGSDDYGQNLLNQGIYTTMSYNTGWAASELGLSEMGDAFGAEAGPMALDIAALQSLYGANLTHNSGATTYVLPDAAAVGTYFSCIWDAGGRDVILYDGAADVTIDLRAATLTYEEGGGGFMSRAGDAPGGYTIAAGVIIEDARAGSGNDAITGNDADNKLEGLGGNDTLTGGGGKDNILGGVGSDHIYGGDGRDRLIGNRGSDTILGGAERDIIKGGSQNDQLWGEDGNDRLKGNRENDLIYGGSGPDNIRGNRGNDTIYGGEDADILYGGGEDDTLFGSSGNDTLEGGRGADSFVFLLGDAADTISDFNSIEDRIHLGSDLVAANGGIQAIIDSASVTAGGVRLDFGGGDSLLIEGLTGTGALPGAIDVFADMVG